MTRNNWIRNYFKKKIFFLDKIVAFMYFSIIFRNINVFHWKLTYFLRNKVYRFSQIFKNLFWFIIIFKIFNMPHLIPKNLKMLCDFCFLFKSFLFYKNHESIFQLMIRFHFFKISQHYFFVYQSWNNIYQAWMLKSIIERLHIILKKHHFSI